MSKKVLVNLLVIAALTIAGVVGVAAYQTSQAAAPALSGVASGLNHDGLGRGPGGATDEYLAEALGITTDELSAAYEKASAAAIAQAVEKGLITQAQADEMAASGRGFPFGGRGGGLLGENDIDFNALLADALGISTDELQAAREKAEQARLDQAIADGQLTQEQADLMQGKRALYADEAFQTAMKTAFEAAVQDAVSRGVITQAQADQILEQSANGMGGPGMSIPGMDRPGRGGHRGGPGGMDGGLPGVPPADAPTTAPSTGG
jgi:transcriptional regulator with XRE-family HTH domain